MPIERHNHPMDRVAALPFDGEVFDDGRDGGRAMRLSWHHEAGLVVVSIWREGSCVASFQLQEDDVPRLIAALAGGLAEMKLPAIRPRAV